MKKICILGAGTAGTMMAHHLARALDKSRWSLTVIGMRQTHYYQPGFLFVPFGRYTPEQVKRPGRGLLPGGVGFINERVERIDPSASQLEFANGKKCDYDILIIATGSRIEPGQTEGLLADGWRKNIFDFYTIEGATALRDKLHSWEGGKLVVHLSEMPIKCPVAPLEFTFLADSFFHKKGMRDRVDITYVTPLPGAFTKAQCSEVLGYMLTDKKIKLETDFDVARVDPATGTVHSWDDRVVPYDLLVTVPTNMGDEVIERSGLGNELRFVPTEKHTLRSKAHENIFVIGDATDLPSSKAGSVAHFQAEVLTRNILHAIRSEPLEEGFDGHANCFIESGFGKAFLIDFNYDVEPMRGMFPLPFFGPLQLLKETRLNHLGKMAFGWVYWNILLNGLPMPLISSKMSMAGKRPGKHNS